MSRMKPEFFAAWLHRFLKLLMRMTNGRIASVLGFALWVARFLAVSEEQRVFLKEAREIFQEGGQNAELARRMVYEGDPRRIRSIFRFHFR